MPLSESCNNGVAFEHVERGSCRFLDVEAFGVAMVSARSFGEDGNQLATGQASIDEDRGILFCPGGAHPLQPLVFDAGLGDLFNARIRGNIADPDLVGSMEFACAVSGAKLRAGKSRLRGVFKTGLPEK